MASVGVVIGHIFATEPAQVVFTDHDDAIEQLSAKAADPTLRHRILPWAAICRPHGFDAGCLESVDHCLVECRAAGR